MKTCPICNKPIDIMRHAEDAWQVVSHGGYWYSKVFKDADEAFAFKQSFNIEKEFEKSREVVDYESGKARLVGDKWETKFMAIEGLKAWKEKLKSAQSTPKQKQSKPNATPAE